MIAISIYLALYFIGIGATIYLVDRYFNDDDGPSCASFFMIGFWPITFFLFIGIQLARFVTKRL